MVRSWLLFALVAGCRLYFDEVTAPGDAPADTAGTIRVRVSGWGAITGPGGVACADDCTYTIDGPTTLTATAGEAQQLDQFCGTGSTCEVMPGADVTATFTRAPITANRVFVTTGLASLGSGRAGFDAQCTTEATAHNLGGGPWIAFASISTGDAIVRLAGSRGWVRLDNLPVLDDPSDLGTDRVPRGVVLGPDGLAGPPGIFVLTGSDATGRYVAGNTCSDWTVSTGQAWGGVADAGAQFLGGGTISACNGLLFCFETGKTVAVTIAPPAFPVGRYVFVSNLFDGTSGVAGADTLCRNEALAAGLPGTYKALIASTTQSALDHVGSLAGAWRRPDGASVTRTGLDTSVLSTTFSMTASGAPVAVFPAFGASSLTALATTGSCNDWTMVDSAVQADTLASYRMSPFASSYSSACLPRPVVCVQTQ